MKKKKQRVGLPPPGPAEIVPGKPWILAKSTKPRWRCRCFNSDSLIPNRAAYFIMGHFAERKDCRKQIKDCSQRRV